MDELRRELSRTFYLESRTKKSNQPRTLSPRSPNPVALKKNLSQKTITRVLGFSVPVFFLALWIQLGIYFRNSNIRPSQSIQTQIFNFEELSQIKASVFEALLVERTLLSEALVRGRETQKTALEAQIKTVSLSLDSVLSKTTAETSRLAIEKLKSSFDQWKLVNSEILVSLGEGDVEKADDIYFETSKTLQASLAENFDLAFAQSKVELTNKQGQLAQSQSSFFILLNFAFGFVTLASLIVMLLSRKILTTFEKFIAHVRGHSYAALKEGELFGSSADTLVGHLKLLRKSMNEMQESVLGEKGGERAPRESQHPPQKAA